MTLKRKSVLFFVVLLLLVAAAGLGVAKLASKIADNGASGLFDGTRDSVTGFFTGSKDDANATDSKFQVSADLSLTDAVKLKSADNIRIEFSKPEAQVSVNTEKLDLSQVENGIMELQAFNGKIDVSESIVLDGKSIEMSVNQIKVLPDLEKLDVSLDLKYSLVRLILQLEKFSYTSTGKLDLNNGKVVVSLEDEELELVNFVGNFTVLGNNLQIRGTADNVKVDGKAIKVNIE